MTPKISVITPLFNGKKFIPRLVESVQRQKGVVIEHIIVDDCSTDGSQIILQELCLKYPNIRVVSLFENGGPIIARNMGIKIAKGKYLAFLDADDLWLPEKLLLQSRFMDETGETLSFSDYRHISEDGRKIGGLIAGPARVGWHLHHMSRYLGCLTIMINREKCSDFCFPNISPAVRAEDFLAWSHVIRAHGPAMRCPHDLARYSVVAGSRSSNFRQAGASVWFLYRKVEDIPLVRVWIYFAAYVCFASLKKFFAWPIWPRAMVDEDFEYQLL